MMKPALVVDRCTNTTKHSSNENNRTDKHLHIQRPIIGSLEDDVINHLDESDLESILSKPDDDSIWDCDCQLGEDAREISTIEQLETKFALRDHILDRIVKGKSNTFISLLRCHEQEVRIDERDRLMLRILYDSKAKEMEEKSLSPVIIHSDESNMNKPHQLNGVIAGNPSNGKVADTSFDHFAVSSGNLRMFIDPEIKTDRHRSIFFRLWGFFIYELFTTLPAVSSFVLQTLVEYGSFELTNILIWNLRKRFDTVDNKWHDRLLLCVFLLGLFFMRISGYLYWWMNKSDYGCLKFELHNRLRLGKWDALILGWIQKRARLRCVLFVFGYYLSFLGLVHGFYRCAMVIDESKMLISLLPSSQQSQTALMKPESSCLVNSLTHTYQCEASILHNDDLWEADRLHVYRYWSSRSHDFFVIEGKDGVANYGYPFLSRETEITMLVATVITSLMLLTWYGFFFWEKY